jgi:hypothetical protein
VSVAACARERGISQVLHYTSNKGMMGLICRGALLSRQRVADDPELAFIFQNIWPVKAPRWVDHISMSISQINLDLFQRSRSNYPQFWWAVLSFTPDILDGDGVWFTTTNNAYEDTCERGQGLEGFEAMFADRISYGYYGSVAHRAASRSDALATHRAAEVLYPGELTFEHLQAVYVLEAQHRRLIGAWCSAYGYPQMPVEINPDAFR